MNHWFRLYNTLVDDPKVQQLPETLFKALINLWCVASQNDGVLPGNADIAYKLRVKPEKAAEYVTKLVRAGLIDNVEGQFVPHNWDGRQFQSDSSTDRVKRYRDKKRNVSCNVSFDVSETPVGTDRAEQTKSNTDHTAAAAGVLDENGLKQVAALKALFVSTRSSLGWSIPNLDRIRVWLLAGIQPGTISSAVTPILKRKEDMASLVYCDGAVREAHAAATNLQVVTRKVWVDEGTQEWASHQTVAHERTGRGTQVCDHKDENGRITGRRGWYFDALWAEGFNDFGERIAPSSDDEAAA